MTSSKSELDQQIRDLLALKMSGVIAPGTLKRMTTAEIATALDQPIDEIRGRLAVMIQATVDYRVNPGRFAYFVREHHDGRYSYSGTSPFENLFEPDAFELEKLISKRKFTEVDALLASTGMRARKVADGAPALVWADGTAFSPGARDWYLGQLLGNRFYIQQGPSDIKKAVAEAHDLLRDALDDVSARALAMWVLKTSFPKSTRAQIPRHSAAFEEIARFYLAPGKRLPGYAVDGMFTAGVLGHQWLLRYGVMGAERRLDYVHEAWPDGDHVTGTAAEWQQRMQKFLEHAVEVGARFPGRIFEQFYLGNPLMAPLLKDAAVEGVVNERAMQDEVRILGLKGFKPKTDRTGLVSLPELPSASMSVPEYNRRCKTASLTHFDTSAGAPYAFISDSNGRFYVYPERVGPGPVRKPVRIARVALKFSDYETVARLEKGVCEGWDTLDPAWRRVFDNRMEILLSPARLTLPKVPKKTNAVSVGSKVRIKRGTMKGVEGKVYWLGRSKFGKGLRAGFEDLRGEKHWVAAADLELLDGGSWTPLHAACDAYDVELAAAILAESNVWVNVGMVADDVRTSAYHKRLRYFGGSTPLHVAAAQDAPEIVALLLAAKAEVNCQDAYGNTPLHVAAGAKEVIQLLRDGGADAELKNARGEVAKSV